MRGRMKTAVRHGEAMNCKEFEKEIPDFVNKKMDFLTLQKFHKHMENCEACKEELSIQFLVMEGMQSLEEGDVFDLQDVLSRHLGEARRKIRFHNGCLRLGFLLEIFAVLMVAGTVIWILA
ncbi:MAG: zf-HC2 domain-containing protein [Bacteroidales bacterium]|nr:zf-HC2 domain-containing protein [Lachnoclostridium sp.]MCM1383087.1 zf-HC2 domain-containing protein [Lachnoclostridium sp.]MCM1463856.1 zf-HC2 domain-containing protein [Bacteroidales bacterium]